MNTRVHQGHFARKRFGQNFLTDQFIIDSIVASINPQPGQAIVEIGPGLAALTEPVADRMDKMTVIEIDRDLAARLASHPFLQSKLTIIQQDAMTVDFTALAQERGQPLRVFGNLPYNISTPLMFHLFTFTNAISDMNFMLQKKWLTVWLPVRQQNIRPSECHGTVLLPGRSGSGCAADGIPPGTKSGFSGCPSDPAPRKSVCTERRRAAQPCNHAGL